MEAVVSRDTLTELRRLGEAQLTADERRAKRKQRLDCLGDLDLLMVRRDIVTVSRGIDGIAEEDFIYLGFDEVERMKLLGTGHDGRQILGRIVRIPVEGISIQNGGILANYGREDCEFFNLMHTKDREYHDYKTLLEAAGMTGYY